MLEERKKKEFPIHQGTKCEAMEEHMIDSLIVGSRDWIPSYNSKSRCDKEIIVTSA